jgi:glycerophosphoryl diester phosphodiesterase
MDWLLTTPIAHRGLHDFGKNIPENSLAAFEAARDGGYPVELDVRLLADGAVAVFHDHDLQRMTGWPGDLASQDSQSIRGRYLRGTGQTIPLLGEALDVIGGKVPVLVELKNFGVPGGLETAVAAALEAYDGRYAVQSFNPFSMGWFKVKAPRVTRGHLSGAFSGLPLDEDLKETLRNLELVDVSAPAFVGYDIRRLPFAPVADLRARGLPVIGWTVRTPAELRRAEECCDNYIFEDLTPPTGPDET